MIGVFLLLVGVTDLAAAVAPESTLTVCYTLLPRSELG